MIDDSSKAQFRQLADFPEPIADVYWFPHAGGSTAALVKPARMLTERVTLRAAVLPGREERSHERSDQRTATLIETLAHDIQQNDRPLILIGHSMGATLAYRIAQRLIHEQRPPQILVVLAASSPTGITPQTSLNRFNDDDLLAELQSHGGIADSLIKLPEMRSLFLPMIRADLRLLEELASPPLEPVDIPIVGIRGTLDTLATEVKMLGWQQLTHQSFQLETFSGNHFFPNNAVAEVVSRAMRSAAIH